MKILKTNVIPFLMLTCFLFAADVCIAVSDDFASRINTAVETAIDRGDPSGTKLDGNQRDDLTQRFAELFLEIWNSELAADTDNETYQSWFLESVSSFSTKYAFQDFVTTEPEFFKNRLKKRSSISVGVIRDNAYTKDDLHRLALEYQEYHRMVKTETLRFFNGKEISVKKETIPPAVSTYLSLLKDGSRSEVFVERSRQYALSMYLASLAVGRRSAIRTDDPAITSIFSGGYVVGAMESNDDAIVEYLAYLEDEFGTEVVMDNPAIEVGVRCFGKADAIKRPNASPVAAGRFVKTGEIDLDEYWSFEFVNIYEDLPPDFGVANR